mgnify:CR=1 FL=1
MSYRVTVMLERNEDGIYVWCPELKGCQSQGDTVEEALENIQEAIELYLEVLNVDQRQELLGKQILATSVEVNVA